ncbi:hypothetical protein KFK09_027784 [Dendrobium nobile]|uniref:Uncharacterized protein n=1 Tax=Dendrobium nobile TaxID=94219 RepID=A0A8T3A1H7_DENNO|nr:hypothetical protein KFK09_027784 [Dendrobium nobile]
MQPKPPPELKLPFRKAPSLLCWHEARLKPTTPSLDRDPLSLVLSRFARDPKAAPPSLRLCPVRTSRRSRSPSLVEASPTSSSPNRRGSLGYR